MTRNSNTVFSENETPRGHARKFVPTIVRQEHVNDCIANKISIMFTGIGRDCMNHTVFSNGTSDETLSVAIVRCMAHTPTGTTK